MRLRKDALYTPNILNMMSCVAYICNTFFLHFGYAPYPESSLISMTNDISSWEQFCPKRFNMLKNYVSIYAICTACEDQNW